MPVAIAGLPRKGGTPIGAVVVANDRDECGTFKLTGFFVFAQHAPARPGGGGGSNTANLGLKVTTFSTAERAVDWAVFYRSANTATTELAATPKIGVHTTTFAIPGAGVRKSRDTQKPLSMPNAQMARPTKKPRTRNASESMLYVSERCTRPVSATQITIYSDNEQSLHA